MIVRVVHLHFLIETVQVLYSFCIQLPKISNPNIFRVFPRICVKVSLFSTFVAKDDKTKYVMNPFS